MPKEKIAQKVAKANLPKDKTDLKQLPLDDQLRLKRAELLKARGDLGSTLQNPHRLRAIRKDIARILTKMHENKGKEN